MVIKHTRQLQASVSATCWSGFPPVTQHVIARHVITALSFTMVAIVAVSSMIKVPMGTEAPSTILLIVFFHKSLLLEKMNHDNVKFVCNMFTSIDKGTTVKARSKVKV